MTQLCREKVRGGRFAMRRLSTRNRNHIPLSTGGLRTTRKYFWPSLPRAMWYTYSGYSVASSCSGCCSGCCCMTCVGIPCRNSVISVRLGSALRCSSSRMRCRASSSSSRKLGGSGGSSAAGAPLSPSSSSLMARKNRSFRPLDASTKIAFCATLLARKNCTDCWRLSALLPRIWCSSTLKVFSKPRLEAEGCRLTGWCGCQLSTWSLASSSAVLFMASPSSRRFVKTVSYSSSAFASSHFRRFEETSASPKRSTESSGLFIVLIVLTIFLYISRIHVFRVALAGEAKPCFKRALCCVCLSFVLVLLSSRLEINLRQACACDYPKCVRANAVRLVDFISKKNVYLNICRRDLSLNCPTNKTTRKPSIKSHKSSSSRAFAIFWAGKFPTDMKRRDKSHRFNASQTDRCIQLESSCTARWYHYYYNW